MTNSRALGRQPFFLQVFFGLLEGFRTLADSPNNYAAVTAKKMSGFVIGERADFYADLPQCLYRNVNAESLVDLHGSSAYLDDRISCGIFREFSENTAIFSNNETEMEAIA
jgi:hypothetical protein